MLWYPVPTPVFTFAEEDYDFKVEKWIRLLKDNWIQTVGTLTRLPPGSLSQLGLPLALVVELERIIRLTHEYKNMEFFHIQKDVRETVNDGSLSFRTLLLVMPGLELSCLQGRRLVSSSHKL